MGRSKLPVGKDIDTGDELRVSAAGYEVLIVELLQMNLQDTLLFDASQLLVSKVLSSLSSLCNGVTLRSPQSLDRDSSCSS